MRTFLLLPAALAVPFFDALAPLPFELSWVLLFAALVPFVAPSRLLLWVAIAGVGADLFSGTLFGTFTLVLAAGAIGAAALFRIFDPLLLVSRIAAAMVLIVLALFSQTIFLALADLWQGGTITPLVARALVGFASHTGALALFSVSFALASRIPTFVRIRYGS